jgi:hypothetical protein
MQDWSNYTNPYLDQHLAAKDPAFVKMVTSWVEQASPLLVQHYIGFTNYFVTQRDFGFTYPMQALGNHPFAATLRAAFNATLPTSLPNDPSFLPCDVTQASFRQQRLALYYKTDVLELGRVTPLAGPPLSLMWRQAR